MRPAAQCPRSALNARDRPIRDLQRSRGIYDVDLRSARTPAFADGGEIMTRGSVLGAALTCSFLVLTGAASAKDWKTVVIGMEGAYEPYNLTDPSGKIIGFEPDLAMDVCARIKVECKIIAQDWDGMIPGLQAGKFDVIMDGMSITADRKKEIDFSVPYASVPAALATAKSSPLAKLAGAGKLVNFDKDKAAAPPPSRRSGKR